MTTLFPGAIDSFTTKIDGVTDVLAEHVNSLQDAVVALETVVIAQAPNPNLLYHTLTHDLWLEGVTFNDFTDDTYIGTLWNGLHNGQPPDVSGITPTGAILGGARALKCLFDSASSQAGFVQFLGNQDTVALRGKTLSFSIDVQGFNVVNMRCAILGWAGTADTVTSDVVSAWAAGNPTLATNWSFLGATPASQVISGSATVPDRIVYEGAVIPYDTTINNIAVFVWTPDLEASTDYFVLSRAKLEIGLTATDFVGPDFIEESMRVKRFYQKSFNDTTTPAQNVGINTGEFVFQAITAGASSKASPFFPWTPFMRISPHTVTYYNPAAANALIRDSVAAADGGAPATVATQRGIRIAATGNAGTAAGNSLHVHFTADARL